MKVSNITTDENGNISAPLLKNQNYLLIQVGNSAQVKQNLQPASRIGSNGSRHVLTVTEVIADNSGDQAVPAPAAKPVPTAIPAIVKTPEEKTS